MEPSCQEIDVINVNSNDCDTTFTSTDENNGGNDGDTVEANNGLIDIGKSMVKQIGLNLLTFHRNIEKIMDLTYLRLF